MALNINGRMKVKTLKADFKKEFGLTLRVYDGRSFADEDATLASIRKGDSKGGEFSPRKNTKIGNLEDKIMDMFGIKTQVAGSDDSYLCNNDYTLAKALEADEKLMAKREKRDSDSASKEDTVLENNSTDSSDTENITIEEVIKKIKEVYKDHEDLEEIVNDLEDGSYFDHWAEIFVTEDYGKNVELAKSLFKLLEEKADSFDDFSELAFKVGDTDVLGDKEWAKSLFRKALTYEADMVTVMLDVAERIADEEFLGDKEWAREIVKKALDKAEGSDLVFIASNIISIFEDKEWAKEVYEEAIEKSDDVSVLNSVGNDIAKFFDDEKELCAKAYYKGIEKAEQDPYKFYMKFYIANGILEDVDREKGIEIGLSVIDDDRCDAEDYVEIARSIARGDVPEFKEKKQTVYEKIIEGDMSDPIIELMESYLDPEEEAEFFRKAGEKVIEICKGVSTYCLGDLASAVSGAGNIEWAKEIYEMALEEAEEDDELISIWNKADLDDDEWMNNFKERLIDKCEEDWAKEEIE